MWHNERAVNPLAAITADIAIIQKAANDNLASIIKAVATVQGNVEAQAQVVVDIKANIAAITQAIVGVTADITAVTTGAVVALNPLDLLGLLLQIQATVGVVTQIEIVLHQQLTALVPATQVLLVEVVGLLAAALSGLVTPLQTYLNAVLGAVLGTGVTVTGLRNALTALVSLVANFAAYINLSGA